MRIRKIEICQMPVKLQEPFVISLGSFESANNVVVVIRTDSGLIGFGECSPFLPINGESMETCLVIGKYLAKLLIGQDSTDIQFAAQRMDRVIYGNSSIKSAFDMALYDLASQEAGLPLFAYLGGTNDKELVTDYTVSLDDSQKMVADALLIKERGFQAIKVKLGESCEKDVERIRLIRAAVGTEIPLRIDANQGWDPATAIATLQALEPFHIQHCEEPIPRWNFMELPNVRRQSPIPIMADESCADHHDARRLIELGACDLINIKLGKSSGIFNALKIIQLAEKAKMHLQVGGFLESRLGFTAAAHLSMVSKNILYCDFDTPLMFTEDPISGGITYNKEGVVSLPDAIGLGATVEEDYLAKLKKVVVG